MTEEIMTESEKAWNERIGETVDKWMYDEGIIINAAFAKSLAHVVLDDYRNSLRKAIVELDNEIDEEEMDEHESGIIKGYQTCINLIGNVMP